MADDSEKVKKLFDEYMGRSVKDLFSNHPWIIIDRLADIILSYVRGPIVEIGIGLSTGILVKHAEAFNVPFYTCDSKLSRCDWARKTFSYNGMNIFYGKSYLFMKEFDEKPAIVFLDGDHNFNVLKPEIDFFIPIMMNWGVMFLHDTCPVQFKWEERELGGRKISTQLIRKELEKRNDVDTFTWRYTAAECGLSMILKKDMSEPEYRI